MINTATETFVQQTGIEGLVVINPRVFGDQRGYFYESYNQQQFEKHGLYYNFVQDNQAFSTYGVLRGLHFQTQPYSQTKLVRVVLGEVLDIKYRSLASMEKLMDSRIALYCLPITTNNY